MVPNDRFTRQADLVPRDRLRELRACVIGIGAVGRQVALQLAALGTRQIQLVDFDRVEPTNVTTQAYGCHDVGQLKVVATSQAIRRIDPGIQVESVVDRYRPSIALGQAVFCCVDTITARSAIWRTAGPRCRFWSDARILAEVIRVLAVADQDGRAHYPGTLFAQAQAQTGRCTAQSTIYTASLAAGLMLHQFTRWLRRLPIDRDITVNLLASEWTVVPACNQEKEPT